MKNILLSLLVLSSLTAAACKSGSKCDQVVDHTISLLPDDFKAKVAGDKAAAVAKCEKASPEAQQCALDAKSMEDLMKCPKS